MFKFFLSLIILALIIIILTAIVLISPFICIYATTSLFVKPKIEQPKSGFLGSIIKSFIHENNSKRNTTTQKS